MKLISSKYVIAWVESKGFVGSSWVNIASEQIGHALGLAKIKLHYESVSVDLIVSDYRVKLPCNYKALDCITYNGFRLPNTQSVNNKKTEESIPQEFLLMNYHTDDDYYIEGNYIHTSFKDGTITVYFKRIPIEHDELDNIDYIMMPDSEILIEAVSWYVISQILITGYNHPILKYEFAYKMWLKMYPQAQNDCKGNFTADTRMNIVKMNTQLLTDVNFLDNTRVNHNNSI
jgi:hypothetical protein